jgi:hypothetical protein
MLSTKKTVKKIEFNASDYFKNLASQYEKKAEKKEPQDNKAIALKWFKGLVENNYEISVKVVNKCRKHKNNDLFKDLWRIAIENFDPQKHNLDHLLQIFKKLVIQNVERSLEVMAECKNQNKITLLKGVWRVFNENFDINTKAKLLSASATQNYKLSKQKIDMMETLERTSVRQKLKLKENPQKLTEQKDKPVPEAVTAAVEQIVRDALATISQPKQNQEIISPEIKVPSQEAAQPNVEKSDADIKEKPVSTESTTTAIQLLQHAAAALEVQQPVQPLKQDKKAEEEFAPADSSQYEEIINLQFDLIKVRQKDKQGDQEDNDSAHDSESRSESLSVSERVTTFDSASDDESLEAPKQPVAQSSLMPMR